MERKYVETNEQIVSSHYFWCKNNRTLATVYTSQLALQPIMRENKQVQN